MEYTVIAQTRTEDGRSAARRLRRAGKVPGIIYGIGKPEKIVVDHHDLQLSLQRHEAFHSSVLSVEIDGRKQPALLRELQLHPVTNHILHIDLQAVAEDVEISATIPLHYLDAENSPGVKLSHGIFSITTVEIAVRCLPKDLPEFINVDASKLELNESIHLSDIKVPDGVRPDALARGENPVLAAVLAPQSETEEVAATGDAPAEEGATPDAKDDASASAEPSSEAS